jgi:hypothetical protein
MRVAITFNPRDPHRDLVRSHAERWLRHLVRDRWRLREDEDRHGREVLTFEFMDPRDGIDFQCRTAPAEHRGRLI